MSALDPGTTLWEASAGTGKTFRIAHTVLRLVAEEPDLTIDQILVVTFTEAATAELKDRVRTRLRDGLEGLLARRDGRPWDPPDDDLQDFVRDTDPDTALPRLRQALVDFDLAPISTIHGFCNRMLKHHAFESGAAFDAELVADVFSRSDTVVTDFYLSQVYDASPTFLDAFEQSGLTLSDLKGLAKKVLDPDLEVLPDAQPTPQPDLTAWFEVLPPLQEAFAADAPTLLKTLTDTSTFYPRQKPAIGRTSYPSGRTGKAIRDLETWLEDPTLLPPLFAYHELFTVEHFHAATVTGKTPAIPQTLPAFDAMLAVRASLAGALTDWRLGLKAELIRRINQQIPIQVRNDNLRTYNDLLRDLRAAIDDADKGPRLCRAIREQYRVALIDEFQDTDPVQWAIFEAVFTERMCLIGDPKQAIYQFRGADVHTYTQASKGADHTQNLPVNYRSDKPLVQAVNHLFDRATDPFGERGPTYDPVTPHHADRLIDDDRDPLHIRYLPREKPATLANYDSVLKRNWLNQQLPRMVASDIAEELAAGRRIQGPTGPRRVSPRDCAVLTAANWQAQVVQDALRAKGIPSVRRGRDVVFDSPIASALGLVLDAVFAPTDRSAVCGALACPLMGRIGDDFRALLEDDHTWSDQVGRFRAWHTLWVDEGFVRMFLAWLDQDGVIERLLRDGNERAVTDLLHLGELLHDAEVSGALGPAGLIEWLRARGPDADPEAAAVRLESDADAVKIYTMHSAKGLEWPLVWCPYLWDGVYLRDDDAMHTKFYDHASTKWKLDIGSPDHATHREMRQEEDLEEDLRLVYVALTRARHRCVVYWGVAGGNKSGLAYLLHQDPTAADVARSAWQRTKKDAKIIADLEALSAQPGIGHDVLDWEHELQRDAPRWQPDPLGGRTLRCRPITRKRALDTWWRRSSFSDLCRRTQPAPHEDPLPADDRDGEPEGAEPLDQPVATPDGEQVILHGLRGGIQVGNAIHKILELHDFQQPDLLAEGVRAQLIAHGFDADRWTEPVRNNLQEALDTPLDAGPDGFCLSQISRAHRLDELEFHFPVLGGFAASSGQVSAKDLAAVFGSDLGPGAPAGIGARIAKLNFLPVRGFMHGFVDLIFAHAGRWYVVDWKSNKLGQHHTDYATARLQHKMLEFNYVLQYHLYVLALHRYLMWRLGPAYDYDTHMGGAYYCFTRGMSPRWGADFGVFRDRPTKALIERMDQLFRAGSSP